MSGFILLNLHKFRQVKIISPISSSIFSKFLLFEATSNSLISSINLFKMSLDDENSNPFCAYSLEILIALILGVSELSFPLVFSDFFDNPKFL